MDGNCLYNAASLYLVGNECINLILRLLMSIELFVHNEFDISTFESIWESYDKTICNNKLTLFKSILHFSSGDKISSESHFLEAFCHKAILNFDVSEWSSLV